MKRILSYMGSALILVGLISPVTNVPEAPVVHAESVGTSRTVEKTSLEKELKLSQEEQDRLLIEKMKESEAIAAANRPVVPVVEVEPTAASTGTCADWIAQAGIADVGLANELIRRESGCNPNAINPSSGACGVAQELPCGKSGCSLGDGACQVKWMHQYVLNRYGSWGDAIQWHDAHNWY